MLRLMTEPLIYQLELLASYLIGKFLGQYFDHWVIDQIILIMDLFPSFISL